ncbi:hypothetical protein LOF14_26735 [Klebsiella variicola subsp. variicola]|nr:hypothetical protein LOF14_26735 [Klebsiella variicola subsp. variicola]
MDKRASAVSAVFLGATLANILGVPLGAWVGQYLGWRYTFFYGHADWHSFRPGSHCPGARPSGPTGGAESDPRRA